MHLQRLSIIAVLAMLWLANPLPAQESEDDPEAVTETEETVETEDDTFGDEEIIDEGLDQQGFEKEDDDDFIPTEEIGTDQSIPFPTDI